MAHVILEGKEVNNMTYDKPEVTDIGAALSLIQGSKQPPGEPDNSGIVLGDCELDD
jgi:hypothetical protein